jgi:hypothetical protein
MRKKYNRSLALGLDNRLPNQIFITEEDQTNTATTPELLKEDENFPKEEGW